MFKPNFSVVTRLRRWLHAACLVALVVPCFRAAASCFPPPAGIIGFWEGDGNAIDVVGGNNGTLVSNANATATGFVNSAFGFDGVRSFVQIADSAALRPTNFTIEAWINFTGLTSTISGNAPSGQQYIIFKQNSRTTNFEGFALTKQVNAGSHHVFHFTVIGSGGLPAAAVDSTTFIATNTWYHVAAVRDSSSVYLYINGALQAQTNVSAAQDYGSHPLYFGSTGQTYDGKFYGRLDEVSLYNVALDSGTIASIYNAGASGKCHPPPNDAFANATVISGVSNTVSGTNVNATHEYGETNLPTFQPSGGVSVWWSFTPPDNGTLSVILRTNFAYPFFLAAYSGSAPSNLTLLGDSFRNIGNQFLEQLLTNMSCDVQKNVPCHVSVDTIDGSSTGAFTLSFQYTEAPANDAFAARIPIASTSAIITGSNIAASLEANEPVHSGNQPGRSVWWTWTPASNQPVVLTTSGSTFDTVLDVYINSTLNTLSLVAGNDNCYTFGGTNGPSADPSSRVSFNALAGVPYQIAVSGATNDSGNVSLNFVNVAIQSIVSVTRTVQSDSSVTFNATLQITNMRPSVTGPLRIRLVARPGYLYTQQMADSDPSFISTMDAPDEGIATFNFPSPGTLAADSSTQLTVSGTVDPPYFTDSTGWGFGRVVVAILEENVSGSWKQLDGRLIVTGVWPNVGGYGGPGGGVVTVNAGFGTPGGNPGSIVVSIGPPLALRMGGAWRVSPTNYGSMGELRFFTNFTSNSYSLVVQSTNFTIEVNPVTFLASPSNQNMYITPGSVVPLNLLYTIPSPKLKYSAANGLAISALQTNTGYIIESASSSQMVSGNWQTVTNIILLTTNSTAINNTKPTAISNQFYRAVWSSQ